MSLGSSLNCGGGHRSVGHREDSFPFRRTNQKIPATTRELTEIPSGWKGCEIDSGERHDEGNAEVWLILQSIDADPGHECGRQGNVFSAVC